MSNLTCSRFCLMKHDLERSVDKLAFLKENWPSFAQIEDVDRLSKLELQCTLCLLELVIDALSKDEFSCSNRELIHLVIMSVYIQEKFELYTIKELYAKFGKVNVKEKKKWFNK